MKTIVSVCVLCLLVGGVVLCAQDTPDTPAVAESADVTKLRAEVKQLKTEIAQLRVNLLIAQSAISNLSAQLVQFMTAEPKTTEKPVEADTAKKDQPHAKDNH